MQAPIMAYISNMSLETGIVLDSFKVTRARLLIKKPELDAQGPKTYRLMSKLSYMSKQAKMMVVSLLCNHMADFDFHEPHNLTYKPFHSCETAEIHVQNEILRAMDNKKVGILLLLDLLGWLKEYLAKRQQRINLGGGRIHGAAFL